MQIGQLLVCDAAQLRRRSRSAGYTTPSTSRRNGLQESLADETASEARGFGGDASGKKGMERPIGIEPTPEPWQICRGRIFKDLRDILGSLK
jgi:hypothetical protein